MKETSIIKYEMKNDQNSWWTEVALLVHLHHFPVTQKWSTTRDTRLKKADWNLNP